MDEELYHHGIKGMKWGVRRYQRPDGSLTPEGRSRYGSNNILDKTTKEERKEYRKEMMNRYKGDGRYDWYKNASDLDIAKDIERKQNIKKALIAAGVVGGVAAGGYLAYKYGALDHLKEAIDKDPSIVYSDIKLQKEAKKALTKAGEDIDVVLSKDSVIHRMEAYADKDISDSDRLAYVSMLDKDVKTYKDKLTDWVGTGERYDTSYKFTKDIKIPSKKKVEQTIQDLLDNDPEYKQQLVKSLEDRYRGAYTRRAEQEYNFYVKLGLARDNNAYRKQFVDAALKGLPNVDKDDISFEDAIYSFVGKDKDSRKVADRLISEGYDAIIDYFDAGSFTKKPLILLDPSKSVTKIGEEIVSKHLA